MTGDWVRCLNPHIAVPSRSDGVTGQAYAENITQSKVLPWIAPFVVTGSLKSRPERTSGGHVTPDCFTFGVAEIGGIRRKESAVLRERRCGKILLVNEIEKIAAFEQGVIEALEVVCSLVTVAASPSPLSAAPVKRNGALGVNHGQVGERLPIAEMRLVGLDPAIERPPCLPPAIVFWGPAQPVIPRDHPAGRGLCEPERGFCRRF